MEILTNFLKVVTNFPKIFTNFPKIGPDFPKIRTNFPKTFLENSVWRVPNTTDANALEAERAFPTSDYRGRTGVATCVEEMTDICFGFPIGC